MAPTSAYNAEYYSRNREKIRQQQASYQARNRSRIRAARKGLTVEQLELIVAAQEGMCAVCEKETADFHIDHDHSCCIGYRSCGRCVRGLLCPNCNHMLGKALDDPTILEAGAAYLRAHRREA